MFAACVLQSLAREHAMAMQSALHGHAAYSAAMLAQRLSLLSLTMRVLLKPSRKLDTMQAF